MFQILFFPFRVVGWVLSGIFGVFGWLIGLIFGALGSVIGFTIMMCLMIGTIALFAKIIGCLARGFRRRW